MTKSEDAWLYGLVTGIGFGSTLTAAAIAVLAWIFL